MNFNAGFRPDATEDDLRIKIAGCGGTVMQILRLTHIVSFSGDESVADKVRGLEFITYVAKYEQVHAIHAA